MRIGKRIEFACLRRMLARVVAVALVCGLTHAQMQAGGSVAGGREPVPGGGRDRLVDGRNTMDGRVLYLQAPGQVSRDTVMVVWLHPSGGNAKPEFDWLSQFDPHRRGILLLCPQSTGRGWSLEADGAFVGRAIDAVMKAYEIDPAKIILGGHSSGGHFSYLFGLENPAKFHMIVPAAGALLSRPPKAGCDAPLFHLYHSANDRVVPMRHATDALKALDAAGYVATLTRDRQQHNIAPRTVDILFDGAAYLQGRGEAPDLDPAVARLFGGKQTAGVLFAASQRTANRASAGPAAAPSTLSLKTAQKLIARLTDPGVYDFEAPVPDAVKPYLTLTFSNDRSTVSLVLSASARHLEVFEGEVSRGRAAIDPRSRRVVNGLMRCAMAGGEAGAASSSQDHSMQ